MVWKYVLGDNVSMKVIIPDMGHGNCIGLFAENSGSLLVDCGTQNESKKGNFETLVRGELENEKRVDLIITHYHSDHHNLLQTFKPAFFNNIYVPALPRPSSTANAIFQFVALAIVAQYQDYHLIPTITKYGIVRPLVQGNHFKVMNKDWEALWPNYNIIDGTNERRIKEILEVVESSKRKLNPEQKEEFEKRYNELSGAFSSQEGNAQQKRKDIESSRPLYDQNEISSKEPLRNRQMDTDVQKSLRSVENVFKSLANRASLVVRDTSINFLFTGDVDDSTLNDNLVFGDYDYQLVEASHHGKCYGKAFDNVSTAILVISRKESKKARPEYYRDLSWNLLVDTPRNGNCIVEC